MTYGYIRVSTDKQDVENQKIGINRKAGELRLEIDEWIADEGVSGTKEYRDRNLGVLMDKLKDGDVIIVSEISRLARSVFMLFRIVEHCTQKIDCIIYAVKENQVLKKNDIVSGIILSAYGTAAQIEREMIVKRTREGLERRRQMGVIVGRPVGSKTKRGSKRQSRIEEIKSLLEKKVSISAVSKITGIHKSSIIRIIKEEGIPFDFKTENVNRNEHLSKMPLLDKEKELIAGIISEGGCIAKIQSMLKDKGIEVSSASVRKYIDREGLYDAMLKKNQELRAKYNVDCGKNKKYYRF
jgi:DNA invertase Pin-like site-specific DNA recombinase